MINCVPTCTTPVNEPHSRHASTLNLRVFPSTRTTVIGIKRCTGESE